MKTKDYKGHLALLGAAVCWGLMCYFGKIALEPDSGVTGLTLVEMRMTCAAICFWLASLFAPREHVRSKDLLKLFFAGLMGVVLNQGLFTIGLVRTSPIDAAVMTTMTPIVTMIAAALIIREPVTGKKVIGIFLGALGALTLILSNKRAGGKAGDIWGDLLCLTAQISYAFYLTVFKGLISRYSVITLMKWMFTYSAIIVIPFSYHQLSVTDFQAITPEIWGCVLYVIIGGTFCPYLLVIVGQKTLRPTVVSMYNYVQPIVSSIVSIATGLVVFNSTADVLVKVVAVVLVFTGVYVVTQSKSRAELLAEHARRRQTNGE
ncbi:MAG: DMT family transporter [Prevotellaceae bacterium]|nr:DMT family transporter [Prevotellaceae bacterium]